MNAQNFDITAPNLLGLSDALEKHLLNARKEHNVFESADLAARWGKLISRFKNLKEGERVEIGYTEAEVLVAATTDRYFDDEPFYVLKDGLQQLRGLAYTLDFNAAPAPIDITPEVLFGAAEGIERFVVKEALEENGPEGQTRARVLLQNMEESFEGGDETWELNHDEFEALKGAVQGRKTRLKKKRLKNKLALRRDGLHEDLWNLARTLRTYAFLIGVNAAKTR